MNKFTKRLLALMLSALLALSTMPVAFAEGDAVVEDATTSTEVVEGEVTDESSEVVPEESSEEIPEITSDSLLFQKPYEHNVGTWHTANTAEDAGFLTDGLYAHDWWDKGDVEYFAAKQPNVEIVFDFEATVDFKEVNIRFMEDTGSGIHRPFTLTITAINGEEETVIYDAKVPALNFSAVSDTAITADKLRIQTTGSTYTFIDEVEVFAEAKNDGYPMTEGNITNLVAGMAYTVEGVSGWYNKCGEDQGYLTDGVINWGSGYGGAHFGAYTNTIPVVTFNFDEVKTINEIDIFAIFGRDGIGAPPVVIEYADAEGNWIKVADISALVHQNYIVAKEAIETTALKFTFGQTGFVFLGEIQVYDRVTNMPATGLLVQNDNLLLGKSYTTTVEAFNGGSKDAGNALTDGLKGGSWYGSDYLNAKDTEFEVNFALDEAIEVSEIFMQFLTDSGAGVSLPSKVEILVQASDDAEWVRIYEGAVEASNFRLGTAADAFAAKNIKFCFETGMFGFIKEIEAYKHLTGNTLNNTLEVVPDNDNLLLGKAYTHNVETWYNGASKDTDGTLLTNGVWEGGYSGTIFNPQQDEVVVDFAFDEDTAITDIVLGATHGTAGIAAPDVTISIKDSDDADWTDVFKGNTAGKINLRAEETLTVKFLRFTFNGGTTYKFISEIEAYTYAKKDTATGTMAPIQYSLIKGMTAEYEGVTFAYGGTSNVATWTDAVALADGASYKQAPTFMDMGTFTYLKDGMSFKEVSVATVNPADEILGGAVAGIGSIKIEALIDGEWVVIAEKADYAYTATARLYAFGAEEAITADGVRFTFASNKGDDALGWNGIAISEISVFAEPEASEYDGTLAVATDEPSEEPSEPSVEPSEPPVEGDFTVEILNYGDELAIPYGYLSLIADAEAAEGETIEYTWYKGETQVNTGSYYTMWGGASAGTYKVVAVKTLADATTVTAEDSIVVREANLENVALGKTYEWVTGMWGSYPDTDNKELTDGELSTWRYHTNAAYTGAANPEIILDLGEVKEIYRVFTAFMSTGNSGLALPSAVKYQYSTDKETWYDFGAEWVCNNTALKDCLMVADANVTVPAEAQYIKVNVTGSWVFLGEIEAFAEPVPAAVPVIDVDLEEAVEIEAGAEVTLAVEASTTDEGVLSYQWYKDDAAIEGAVEASLTVSEAGSYKVVVTNTLGKQTATAESAVCVVTVAEEVVPTGYKVSGSLTKSGSTAAATIELIADGETVATTTIEGKTGTYELTDVAAGTYTLKVTKSKHAAREYTVEVVDADVAQDVQVWLYGDVTADGIVNNTDVIQINRRNANQSSVFSQVNADSDYRLIVANVTAITGTDTIVNNTDVIQINRKNANQGSVFDRLA